MKKKDFLAQYQDKRWYELSKRIKARDKNTCQMCGRNDKPVSVHHKVYREDSNVWDYSDDELICICDRCHEIVTDNNKRMYKDYCLLKQTFREFGFSDNVLSCVLSHLTGLLECVENGEEINDFDSLNFLKSVIQGTQDFNDLKVLKRLGVNEHELVKFLYPNLYNDYIKSDLL